jgi:type IV secretory pathway VirB3-like protein
LEQLTTYEAYQRLSFAVVLRHFSYVKITIFIFIFIRLVFSLNRKVLVHKGCNFRRLLLVLYETTGKLIFHEHFVKLQLGFIYIIVKTSSADILQLDS